ncbi:GNAT family N-acetyltransferase [Flavobacterium sp.]|uniref:GNAT family N-acetyltransferase n=1 Tax=Flavobacterium sp. TaxID=239 RepID=UPI002488A67C|nr:GNAT family N-acetyltransferase [Flavobacterium sp.]MDI1316866.1 GNAT family N-acetyltransferase [Flavobacterium sp.]
MDVKWKIKRFEALSVFELYNIMQLRSEVFVVEQNCVYQDVDGKDEKALHLIAEDQGITVAYCRLFKPNEYFTEASIGRVIVKASHRDQKLGHILMKEAIEVVKVEFNETKITISAQLYLKKFYESHGFIQTSETYLEDDIPHIEMKRS